MQATKKAPTAVIKTMPAVISFIMRMNSFLFGSMKSASFSITVLIISVVITLVIEMITNNHSVGVILYTNEKISAVIAARVWTLKFRSLLKQSLIPHQAK